MARRLRVCTVPGCPELTTNSRCQAHAREQDQARGSRTERGYTAEHDRLRAKLHPLVKAGRARCHRCGKPIAPGEAWDLGHNDDRTAWTGPEHASCNRSAGGRAAHGLPPRRVGGDPRGPRARKPDGEGSRWCGGFRP